MITLNNLNLEDLKGNKSERMNIIKLLNNEYDSLLFDSYNSEGNKDKIKAIKGRIEEINDIYDRLNVKRIY